MKQALFELKSHRKSFFFWLGSLIVFIALIMVEFSAYRDNPELLAILDVMPKEILDALGLYGVNLTTISGFVSIALVYLQLALAIYASMLGVTLLSKETRWKTAEFLYVLPRSRQHILTVKFFVGILLVTLMALSVTGAFALVAWTYQPEANFYSYLLRVNFAMYFVILLFYGVGFVLSAILKRSKIATAIAALSAFAFYILSVVLNIATTMDWAKPISLFSYIDFSAMIANTSLPIPQIITCILLTGVCYGVSVMVYPMRDLGTTR